MIAKIIVSQFKSKHSRGLLNKLRAKQRAASEKLQELEKATGDAWKQVKETADKVWEDLKTGVSDAHSKFK